LNCGVKQEEHFGKNLKSAKFSLKGKQSLDEWRNYTINAEGGKRQCLWPAIDPNAIGKCKSDEFDCGIAGLDVGVLL
jgi:hypothetical protein